MKMGRLGLAFVSSVLLITKGVSANEKITVGLPSGVEMEMVWVDPGVFWMGLPVSEGGNVELTRLHEVTISKGFYLGKYEVTQEQWESVMGTQPWLGEDNVLVEPFSPAVYLSWEEVQGFIDQLNQSDSDAIYRLPTEAEWEYACRAGSDSHWWFGDDESRLRHYGWYDQSIRDLGLHTAQPVGDLQPNPWGLYDMNGNALEWVQDWWGDYPSDSIIDPMGPETGSIRVLRGGAFDMDARLTWSGSRAGDSPSNKYSSTGVRLVRVESEATPVSPRSWGRAKHHTQ